MVSKGWNVLKFMGMVLEFCVHMLVRNRGFLQLLSGQAT